MAMMQPLQVVSLLPECLFVIFHNPVQVQIKIVFVLEKVLLILSINAGMVLPFATQTDEMRALAKHCSAGIELRVSNERMILLDTQVNNFVFLLHQLLENL
jgi:hypothetical protein